MSESVSVRAVAVLLFLRWKVKAKEIAKDQEVRVTMRDKVMCVRA